MKHGSLAPDAMSRRTMVRCAGQALGALGVVSMGACAPAGIGVGERRPSGTAEVKLRYLAWLREWGEGLPSLAGPLREQQ
ncbi:MAG: hypothetical protein ACRDJN_23090, partial [Chloroflexota bacterium]